MPSGPGAPRFALTFFQANAILASSTICSISFSKSILKAVGFMIAESDCFALEVSRARAFIASPLVESVELGSMCLGRFEVMIGCSLLSDVRPFLFPLVLEAQYYGLCCLLLARFRVTSSRPAFRASPTHGYAQQISPDKNVNFHCTSSSSTFGVCWERFRYPRLTHLRASLGLYDVSVRSLAVWTRCFMSAQQQVSFTLRVPNSVTSQASSPRFVTSPQLPSSST